MGVWRTCHLFFAAEREFWQRRNRAAQIQKERQDDNELPKPITLSEEDARAFADELSDHTGASTWDFKDAAESNRERILGEIPEIPFRVTKVERATRDGISRDDAVATLTAFTVESVARACRDFATSGSTG